MLASAVAPVLELGSRRFDTSARAVVMGIANRTPDSFFDKGTYFDFDRFLAHCDRLLEDGADVIDVGGVKAGAGPEVGEAEELDRVVGAVQAIASRLDVAISVDTWRASVARACFEQGAVLGNDISGFADPAYLEAAAAAGASVVATHIRLAPRVPDPDPPYGDVVSTVEARLVELAGAATRAGISPERIIVDPGLDLGKTTAHSLELLGAAPRY
ncbi:MAG: dihydropteroate synthase, partial [Acidimicrobiales bacterium]